MAIINCCISYKTNKIINDTAYDFYYDSISVFDNGNEDFDVRGCERGPPSVDPPPYSLRGECPGVVVIDNDAGNALANFKFINNSKAVTTDALVWWK